MKKNYYHYTNLKSLMLIIKGNSILFSNSLKTNDDSETDVFKSYLSNDPKLNTLHALLLGCLPEKDEEHKQAYILSMSSSNDILTCWREYGDYGKGVCLEINIDKLKVLLSNSLSGINYYIEDVVYNPKKQKEIVKKLESSLKKNKDPNSNIDTMIAALPEIIRIKHFINKEEKECRVCILMTQEECKNMANDRFDYLEEQDAIKICDIFCCIEKIYLGPNVTIYEKKKIEEAIVKKSIDVLIDKMYFPIKEKPKK